MSKILQNFVPAIKLTIISIFFTLMFFYPMMKNISSHLTSRADGVFISWTITTVAEQLISGKNIFQMPLYFPFTNTLTYSDPFIPTAILSIPLLFFTKNIIFIHNFHLITGAIFLYLSSYFLGKQLRFSNISSHFTALLFSFSSIQMQYIVHLHTYLIAGLPLTFLFFLKWLENNKWQWLLAVFLAFLYQSLNSPMTGFFILFALAPFLLDKKNLIIIWQQIKKNSFLFSYYLSFSLLILGFTFFPYFATAQEFEYTRTIRDAAHFAFSINRLFQPDILILLMLIFILWKTQNKSELEQNKTNNKTVTNNITISKKNALYMALIGTILMLGPVLKINDQTFKLFGIPLPLPYAILYYVIPGFQAFRASSRWIILLNFGLALIFGHLINNSKLKAKILYGIFGFLLSTQLFFHFSKFELFEIPIKIPEIYNQIKTLEPNNKSQIVLVEFPVFSWRMMPYAYLENDRLLYQHFHKQILFNGVSGFTPPQREKEWDWLWNEFPNSATIEYLKNEGVQYILIHYDLYDKMYIAQFNYKNQPSPDPGTLSHKINTIDQLQLIICKNQKCLYKIR